MTIKSWIKETWEDYPAKFIIGMVFVMGIISFVILLINGCVNAYLIYPNKACNECGYGNASELGPYYSFSQRIQCDSGAIISYDLARDVYNKWDYLETEKGFWVSC